MSDDSGSSRSSVSESTCYSSTDSEVEEPEEGTFQTDGIRGHLTYLQCYFKHMKLKKYDPEGKIEDRLRDFAPSCRFAPVHAKYVYLTHWKGYKDEDDTWECETQFARNADLKKYKKEHNLPKELETIKYSLSWETDKVNFDLKTKDWNELTIHFADFLESLSGKKPKAVTKQRLSTPVPECTEKIVGHLTFLEAYYRHMVLQKEGVPKPETIFNFFLSQDAKNSILHSEYVFKVRSTKDRQSISDKWLMEKDIAKKTSDLVAYKKANRLPDGHRQTEKKFSWEVKEHHFGIEDQYYKAFKKRFKEVREEATSAATAPPAAVASKSAEGRKERKTEADVLTETWETPAAERFIQLKERDEAKKKAETDRLKDMVRNINAGAGDSTADEDYEESSVASERAPSPTVQKKKKKSGGAGDSATKQRTPSKSGGGSGLRDGKKEKRKSVPVATPIARVLNEDELFPKGERSRARASSSGAGGSSPSVNRQRLSTSTAGAARPTPMAKALLKKTTNVESKEEEEAKEMQNRMRQWSKEAHAVPKPRKAMKQSIITDDGREVPVAELVKNDLILKTGGAQKVPSKTLHAEQIIVDDIPDEYEDHDYSLQDHFNDEREYEREESAKNRRRVEMGEEYGNNNEMEMKSSRAEKKEKKKEKEKKRREKEETADTVRKAARTVKVFGWYRHQSLPFCDIPYPRRRCHSAPPCADRAKSQWEQMKRENRTIIRYNAVINRGRNKNPGFNVREFLSDCIRDIPLKSVSYNLKQKVSSKGAVRYVCAQEADRDFLKQNNVFFGVPVNPVDIDPTVYETGPAVATHGE